MDGRRCRVVETESDRTRALRDIIAALAGSRVAYNDYSEPEIDLDDDREMAEING
jgi:hypothetical protein